MIQLTLKGEKIDFDISDMTPEEYNGFASACGVSLGLITKEISKTTSEEIQFNKKILVAYFIEGIERTLK